MVRAAILFHIKRRVFHVWELNAWSTEHIKWKISIGNLPEQVCTKHPSFIMPSIFDRKILKLQEIKVMNRSSLNKMKGQYIN